MPIYEYQCEEHGNFTRQIEIAKRNDDCFCPACGTITKRVISAPSLSLMSDTNREAWSRNEKSAHEPMRKKKHVCSHSCNHGSHDKSSSNNQSGYMQAQNKGRPWMLGH